MTLHVPAVDRLLPRAEHSSAPPPVYTAVLMSQTPSTPAPRRPGQTNIGAGTPWEDRGAIGIVPAFFRTLILGIRRPAELLASVRRPETYSDATFFALGCGLIWTLGLLVQSIFFHLRYAALPQPTAKEIGYYFYPATFWLGATLGGLLLAVLMPLALRFIAMLFHRLAAAELSSRQISVSMIHNTFGYCLGPSIVAVVPLLGPPVALVWVLWLWMATAKRRFRMNSANAITCVLIPTACALAMGVVIWLLAQSAWNAASEGGSVETVNPLRSVR